MKKIWGEQPSRFLITAAGFVVAVSLTYAMCVAMPAGELSRANPGIELVEGSMGDHDFSASPPSSSLEVAQVAELTQDDSDMKVVVLDPETMQEIVPPKPCGFGYKYVDEFSSRGCVTRGKFVVGPHGSVWRVACRLGNCWKFSKLCLYLPRPPGWGDEVLLPKEIKYREVPPEARAGTC